MDMRFPDGSSYPHERRGIRRAIVDNFIHLERGMIIRNGVALPRYHIQIFSIECYPHEGDPPVFRTIEDNPILLLQLPRYGCLNKKPKQSIFEDKAGWRVEKGQILDY
jgi:hypothetical protein